MKKGDIKPGMVVWVPCEVRPGPFPNERKVYIKLDNSEWFGFVDVLSYKEGAKLRTTSERRS